MKLAPGCSRVYHESKEVVTRGEKVIANIKGRDIMDLTNLLSI